jgi:hypothetical protein
MHEPLTTEQKQRAKLEENVPTWDELVAEGKAAASRIDHLEEETEKQWFILGKCSHHVETHYGQQSLAKFASEIGVCPLTLERKRSVYRAWHVEIPAPGPISKAKLLTANPSMTKAEAQKIMRQWRKDNKAPKDELARWCRELSVRLNEAAADATMIKDAPDETRKILRDIVERDILTQVDKAIDQWIHFADYLHDLLEETAS